MPQFTPPAAGEIDAAAGAFVPPKATEADQGYHPLAAALNGIGNFWDQVKHGPANLYDVGKGLAGLATGETEKAMGAQNAELWKKATDAYDKRDYTAAAAHLLNYTLNGIPGLGLGTSMDRAGEKFAKGDVSGGIGDTLGTAANLYTMAKSPRIADAVVENAPIAAAAIKGAATGAAKAAAQTAQFKGFSVPGGNVMAGAVGGGAAAHALGLPGEAGALVGAAAPIVEGAVSGARSALAARVAKLASAQKILDPATAADILDEINGGAEAAPEAAAAQPAPEAAAPAQATPAMWPKPAYQRWEPGPPGTPAPAQPWAPYAAPAAIDAAPDARATLPPELVAKVDELRAQTHPDSGAAQALDDFLTQHSAWKQMQAQDVEWGNRAASADSFAQYLTRNKLDPTPANIAKAARELVKDPPSGTTVDMIQDRMGYTEPAPASELEQQLADSIAAVKAKGGTSADLLAKSRAAFDQAKKDQAKTDAGKGNSSR